MINDTRITIFLAEDDSTRDSKSILEDFLITLARSYITNKANEFSRTFDFAFNRIAIKEQRSRWGSCSSLKNLNFNWRLIFAYPEVVDYVIIHELAHTKQMNHSSSFWNLLEDCMPDYKIHRDWLKINGKQLFKAF